MVRAVWSGSISFGLVNVPVKLVNAVSEKDVRFHMLHDKDGARIRFRRVCPEEDVEVPNEHIVRGYEIAHDQYVTFTDEELEAAAPEAARTIEIQEFVDQREIDPSYYDKPYYLVADKNAQKPYSLLLAAMQKADKVAIARVVMHDKEHLVAIRPRKGSLMMETMHWSEEVLPAESIAEEVGADTKVDAKQLDLALKLVESLSLPFDPERHHNTHREKVMRLIERKAAGEKVVVAPAAKPTPRTTDILAALEESLQHATAKSKARPHGKRATPLQLARPAKRQKAKAQARRGSKAA